MDILSSFMDTVTSFKDTLSSPKETKEVLFAEGRRDFKLYVSSSRCFWCV